MKRILKMIYWTVTALALILSVTVATYAWFTLNQTVNTDTATGRTNTEEVTLEISEQGGNAFSPVDEAAIIQVNQMDKERLMPVSTSNLQSFVYNSLTVQNQVGEQLEDQARSFSLVEDESYYYHGRIFLRAVSSGMDAGTRLALYLDTAQEAGGAILSDVSKEVQTAARLGLMFDGNADNTVIFRMEDAYSSSGALSNTYVNGNRLKDNEVLAWNGSGVSVTTDPSVTIGQYTIQTDDADVSLPERPLIYMEFNQIYQVDVYFYLEGCDPDCSDNVRYGAGNLHLAFYGMTV